MIFKSAILCAAIAAPSIAQAEYWLFPIVYEVVGVTEGGVLNVRYEPNVNAYDLGELLLGQQAEVTGFDETGNWARVMWDDEDGWALDLLETGREGLWSGCCSTILPVVDGY